MEPCFTSGCEIILTSITYRPAPPGGSDDEERTKKGCCHGGLPWWFVFVGWFLVAATGVVTSYFTMLYGLKFGKERSISWLVSMVVSFFQSVLITQPIKVRKNRSFQVFFFYNQKYIFLCTRSQVDSSVPPNTGALLCCIFRPCYKES